MSETTHRQDRLRAVSVQADMDTIFDTITLAYDDRFRRRIALVSDNGLSFLLDLNQTTELSDGDVLCLTDGRNIRVVSAAEDLMEAVADDPLHLTRTAWHIGNRHLPCEILTDKIVLRWDHVIAEMLEKQGCLVSRVSAPFNPGGGAYGNGRTHGHTH
ncbi:MAG: urease accessory protein UreE [Rhodobacteraceae bacterium]|nr:urease accessory protein UreE [Paracoccaceae bacterium]